MMLITGRGFSLRVRPSSAARVCRYGMRQGLRVAPFVRTLNTANGRGRPSCIHGLHMSLGGGRCPVMACVRVRPWGVFSVSRAGRDFSVLVLGLLNGFIWVGWVSCMGLCAGFPGKWGGTYMPGHFSRRREVLCVRECRLQSIAAYCLSSLMSAGEASAGALLFC